MENNKIIDGVEYDEFDNIVIRNENGEIPSPFEHVVKDMFNGLANKANKLIVIDVGDGELPRKIRVPVDKLEDYMPDFSNVVGVTRKETTVISGYILFITWKYVDGLWMKENETLAETYDEFIKTYIQYRKTYKP